MGFAWASLSYSSYVEDSEAIRVLSEGLTRVEDDTHPLWHLYAHHDNLRKRLNDRLDSLPKAWTLRREALAAPPNNPPDVWR
jgi:hypothetical protein